MNIYLIRHGRQANKLVNSNVSLSVEGRRQAELVGSRLLRYHPQILYSSNLIRAVETAEIINSYLDLPYRTKEDLREICFGDLENHSDAENLEHFPAFLEAYGRYEEDIPYPGGECGRDVYNRGIKAIYEIIAEAREAGYERVAVVTHGVFIRSLLAGIFGKNFAIKALLAKGMENGSITELQYLPDRDLFTLERLNDYAHLEDEPELLRRTWK